MRIESVALIGLVAGIANAFRNADTMILASTVTPSTVSQFDIPEWTVDSVSQVFSSSIKACPFDNYIFVTLLKDGDSPSAVTSESAPFIDSFIHNAEFSRRYEAYQDSSLRKRASQHQQRLAEHVSQHCDISVIQLDSSSPISSQVPASIPRGTAFTIESDDLSNLDLAFDAVNSRLQKSSSVGLYFHVRSLDSHVDSREVSESDTDDSLFAKYQFFGSGVFMTMIVALFCILALVTAQSWLSSLQVSYRAFEAPSGPDKQEKFTN